MSNKEIFIETYNKNIHRPGAEKLLAWLEGTDFFTGSPHHAVPRCV